jgi:hypothetical protein
MSPITSSTERRATTSPSTARIVARWMISFVGFPLGGLAALLLVGPVVSTPSALAGGLVTGAVLGLVQGWALRADRRLLLAWTGATAGGLAVGLAAGTLSVDFGTGLGDLAIQGLCSGAAVGLAQAVLLWPRIGRIALAWPAYLAGVWGVGWTVTTSIGVEVSDGFTVFGSSGALVVTVLTAVLPVLLAGRASAAGRTR